MFASMPKPAGSVAVAPAGSTLKVGVGQPVAGERSPSRPGDVAAGSAGAVTVGTSVTVSVSLAVASGATPLVAVTVKLKSPDSLGVPDSNPSEAERHAAGRSPGPPTENVGAGTRWRRTGTSTTGRPRVGRREGREHGRHAGHERELRGGVATAALVAVTVKVTGPAATASTTGRPCSRRCEAGRQRAVAPAGSTLNVGVGQPVAVKVAE